MDQDTYEEKQSLGRESENGSYFTDISYYYSYLP